jgi:hypothetical protein
MSGDDCLACGHRIGSLMFGKALVDTNALAWLLVQRYW